MSEKTELSFYEKLILVITELNVPKGQFNKFGKYPFRNAEDILEAVKPIAAKYGLYPKLTDEPILVGDWHYMKATASITDGVTTEYACAYAREPQIKKGMDESQISGTASSYARKYAMNGLYQIDDQKDSDSNEYSQQVGNQKAKKISNPNIAVINKKLQELADEHKITLEKSRETAFKRTGINKESVSDLTDEEGGIILNYLNKAK